MNHTPGPWLIGWNDAHEIGVTGGNGTIARLFHNTGHAEADARLIAAAPVLLALLQEWRNTSFFEGREEWERWVAEFGARVDATIAKAAGAAANAADGETS